MEVLHRLMAISQTGALLLDGDMHNAIATRYPDMDQIQTTNQDVDYQKMHQLLRKIKDVNQLETPLYTIVFFPADSTFRFIVTSSDKPYYRHAYKNYPNALLNDWEIGGTLDSYHDENGQWLSAFAPVRNREGKVVALLEADENFESFAMRARNELWRNALLSMLLVIPFGLLLFNYFARTFKKQEEDQQMLLQQKEEIEAQNEEIKTQSDVIEEQNHDLEMRVQQRTAELQTTNEQLANFLYHSSHDVQAPIATLKGLKQLLTYEVSTENGKEYVGRMQITLERLDQMVKTIQKVHHVKTIAPHYSPTNIEEVALQVFESFPMDNSKIHFRVDANIIIHTDRELLKMIVYEILKNALHFNPYHPNLIITIQVKQIQQQWCISIHNNGEPITNEARQNLFVMFKRGHELSHGIGLGLYTAAICAQRMNGRLTLDDQNETGVAFLIWLENS